MLHTKFHGNMSTVSEKRFLKDFNIYGRDSHLRRGQSFVSSIYTGSTQNLASIGHTVLEKTMFEMVNG